MQSHPELLAEFVERHCEGKQYDSCRNSPCPYSSFEGCRHPAHPKNQPLRERRTAHTARIKNLTRKDEIMFEKVE